MRRPTPAEILAFFPGDPDAALRTLKEYGYSIVDHTHVTTALQSTGSPLSGTESDEQDESGQEYPPNDTEPSSVSLCDCEIVPQPPWPPPAKGSHGHHRGEGLYFAAVKPDGNRRGGLAERLKALKWSNS